MERTAFLVGESAVFAMQIERVIRNAANPNRRAFRDPGDLRKWLAEILTATEAARLGEFLSHSGSIGRKESHG